MSSIVTLARSSSECLEIVIKKTIVINIWGALALGKTYTLNSLPLSMVLKLSTPAVLCKLKERKILSRATTS